MVTGNWYQKLRHKLSAVIHGDDTRERVDLLEQEVRILRVYRHKQEVGTLQYSEVEGVPQLSDGRLSMEECFEKLREKAPVAFDSYMKLYENNISCYKDLPTHSCSVDGHNGAECFREYISSYLHGYVLDIGCGVQNVPLYLKDYPIDKVYGIDPLEPHTKHDFNFQRGICEFLPYNDSSFNCVLFATSLDHVFLIDQSMEEVRRVLVDDGFVIFWLGFDEEAPDYNPYDPNFTPYDQYHMFHLRRTQFKDIMAKCFTLLDEYSADNKNYFFLYRCHAPQHSV